LPNEDLELVFNYLDKNKDSFISYQEFCGLCEEKRRDIDPFDTLNPKPLDLSQLKAFELAKSYENLDELEKLSNASHMYKGFKSNKLKSKQSILKNI
jgi:Ca2+-binding EF-hand superfamily protein